jgi:hypothetical protein
MNPHFVTPGKKTVKKEKSPSPSLQTVADIISGRNSTHTRAGARRSRPTIEPNPRSGRRGNGEIAWSDSAKSLVG